MIRILHVITGLSTGGAETVLCRLLAGLDRQRFACAVLSLTDRGTRGVEIGAMGVPLQVTAMGAAGRSENRGRPNLVHTLKFVRGFDPDLIQGWMYHGNLAAWALRFLTSRRRPRLVWNVRCSVDDLQDWKRSTRRMIMLGARLSPYTDRIIYNAGVSARQHADLGYTRDRAVVIHNGFDTALFRPDENARRQLRTELGLSSQAVLIGLVARYHEQKDHPNFLAAAAALCRYLPGVHFVLAGSGVDSRNRTLMRLAAAHGLTRQVHLLGEQLDVARIQAALDIAALTSAYSEGLPNTIGEAMSCAVPCVVTDVGNVGMLVGNTGKVVPPRDPRALARAWRDLLDMEAPVRRELGQAARRRVITRFSLPAMVARYEALYARLCQPKSAGAH